MVSPQQTAINFTDIGYMIFAHAQRWLPFSFTDELRLEKVEMYPCIKFGLMI